MASERLKNKGLIMLLDKTLYDGRNNKKKIL